MAGEIFNPLAGDQYRRPGEFDQRALIAALQAKFQNPGQTVGAAQYQLASQQAIDQSYALANAQRGNRLAALRGAQDVQADVLGRAGLESSMLASQEQQQYAGLLSDVLTRKREQDLARKQADRGFWSQLVGGGLGALGAGLGMAFASDERVKDMGPAPSGGEMDAMMAAMRPAQFTYAGEPSAAPPRIGVVAQNLERAPGGGAMVREGPGGVKMIDAGAGMGAMMAALGRLHERVFELEGRRKAA